MQNTTTTIASTLPPGAGNPYSNNNNNHNGINLSDPIFYGAELSSTASSTPLSPSLSSPATPALTSLSPQDTTMTNSPPMFPDITAGTSSLTTKQNEKPSSGTKSKKSSVSAFIKKLYSMVNDKSHQDLISWGTTGESFIIYNSKKFSREVLPEHFKHGNFSSFVRQLNMYGFRKINKASRGKHGTDQNELWEFMHPQFQRDRKDKLSEIKRKAANSEMLRRDTGNIHLSVRKIQSDQQKLLDQFQVLQNNFSTLWQGYEDLKRNQHDLQQGIHKLADKFQQQQQQQQRQHQNMNIFAPFPISPAGGDSNGPNFLEEALKSPLPPSPMQDAAFIDPGKLTK